MKIFYIGKRRNNKENNNINAFKVIFKRNQIVLLAISLMLVTAGYMNYNNNIKNSNVMVAEIGDAQLVSAETVSDTMQEQNLTESDLDSNMNLNEQNCINYNETENNINTNSIEIDNKVNVNNAKDEEADETNAGLLPNNETNYFAKTRIERESMYSQMQETYQKILENEKIPNDQKLIATNEIKNINDRKNAIQIIENLVKNRGFKDVVILINDNNIDAIVKEPKGTELKENEIAQIESIVSRELNASIEDIHISIHE